MILSIGLLVVGVILGGAAFLFRRKAEAGKPKTFHGLTVRPAGDSIAVPQPEPVPELQIEEPLVRAEIALDDNAEVLDEQHAAPTHAGAYIAEPGARPLQFTVDDVPRMDVLSARHVPVLERFDEADAAHADHSSNGRLGPSHLEAASLNGDAAELAPGASPELERTVFSHVDESTAQRASHDDDAALDDAFYDDALPPLPPLPPFPPLAAIEPQAAGPERERLDHPAVERAARSSSPATLVLSPPMVTLPVPLISLFALDKLPEAIAREIDLGLRRFAVAQPPRDETDDSGLDVDDDFAEDDDVRRTVEMEWPKLFTKSVLDDAARHDLLISVLSMGGVDESRLVDIFVEDVELRGAMLGALDRYEVDGREAVFSMALSDEDCELEAFESLMRMGSFKAARRALISKRIAAYAALKLSRHLDVRQELETLVTPTRAEEILVEAGLD